MKKRLFIGVMLCAFWLCGCQITIEDPSNDNSEVNQESQIESESSSEESPNTESLDSATELENETELASETESEVVETEEEYKSRCVEVFNGDIFSDKKLIGQQFVGQHVKMYCAVAGWGEYTPTSTFGYTIRDLAAKYDLDKEYLGLNVAHEGETSYMAMDNLYAYLLFDNQYSLSIEDYKNADFIIVYGEAVLCMHGFFVIPRYIEISEDPWPHLK